MRVFLAGASGAIGRPLVQQLLEAGHDVLGTTRSQARADEIGKAGATPLVVDCLDGDALRAAVSQAEPDVVINELTALPERLDFRKPEMYEGTNRLRSVVGPALAGAASEAGAQRLISQSIAFYYEPRGDGLHTEDDPMIELPPGAPMAPTATAMTTLERATLETPQLEGLVLRYGFFYGPGTYYAADGSTAADVRRRRFPIVGGGTGVFSFVHTEDAAAATVAAVDQGSEGIYNVCDDDPAPMSEWLPEYADAIGAKPPWRVPAWLARLIAGRQAVRFATELRGASNEKAKRELGWRPRYPSWRQGFREALG
jgi:nucleoside-diphosphate-sugar epimerase